MYKQTNKWILLVWYNYRFLLFCFPHFFNMLVQLTIHVVLLFLVQVGWQTVHIISSPSRCLITMIIKEFFKKGIKPQHEENGREAIHGWEITFLDYKTGEGTATEERGQGTVWYRISREGECGRGDSHFFLQNLRVSQEWEALGHT